ncbi:MAG: arsenate reductase ArsC [Dehalococcoidales bacterium]|nr:arsenate reductase ArsC [Dehalococcoidales bacterium]
MKKRALLVCTNNSCRSQMAEGIVNYDLGNQLEAFSAGIMPTFVHPRAIEAMKEIGIAISGQRSKSMAEFTGQPFDYVITLCDNADEKCPLFFGDVKKMHVGFADPAAATGTEEEMMTAFRKVRDEIGSRLLEFFSVELAKKGHHGN